MELAADRGRREKQLVLQIAAQRFTRFEAVRFGQQ
jgi:hypothetical protein